MNNEEPIYGDPLDLVPPHSIEAEQNVIGSMILNEKAAAKAQGLLKPSDFYRKPHEPIFAAICALLQRQEAIDTMTVMQELKNEGKFMLLDNLQDGLDAPRYLLAITDQVASPSHVTHYAKIVREKSRRRRILERFRERIADAYDTQKPIDSTISEAMTDLAAIAHDQDDRQVRSYQEIADKVYDNVDAAIQAGTKFIGLPTGIGQWDRILKGMKPQTVTIVAGRPGLGKTTLMLQVAKVLAQAHVPVGIFSLEMSAEQLALRSVSSMCGITASAIESGSMTDAQVTAYTLAHGIYRDWPIYVCDLGGLTIQDIMAKSRQMVAEHSIQVVMIDHLGEVVGDSRHGRMQEVSQTAQGLKQIAKALDIPALALCQLSRNIESRVGNERRPRLSDLRDTGRLEEIAESVTFIWNPNPVSEDFEYDRPIEVELWIAKQRNGRLGAVRLMFDGNRYSFTEISKQADPGQELPYYAG